MRQVSAIDELLTEDKVTSGVRRAEELNQNHDMGLSSDMLFLNDPDCSRPPYLLLSSSPV
jgi:hypothetical protein